MDAPAASAEATAMQKESYGRQVLEGKQILLAEDHPLNAEIATKILQKVGCVVTWVKNGQECVDLFEHSSLGDYDIILMDIRMPVMDGIDATKAIRSLPRRDAQTVPVIAMTANAFEEDVKACLDAGMNDHLAKPVNPQLLYDTLQKHLSSKDCLFLAKKML